MPREISRLPKTPADYVPVLRYLNDPAIHADDKAHLFIDCAQRDFWFFCRYATRGRSFYCEKKGCQFYGMPIFEHPFIFERCRAVQAAPDSFLDLWPRGHLKTTIITMYLTMWDFLERPDDRVAIVTWKITEVGDKFVEAIQAEMEPGNLPDNPFNRRDPSDEPQKTNEVLAYHWPEIFWSDPKHEASAWKQGLLNLKGHPGTKENSISVMGLNAMKTSQHYSKIIYDDIVNEISAANPDACRDCTDKFRKTVGMWSSTQDTKVRGAGTRWDSSDTYRFIIDKGILRRRVGPEDCYGEDGQSIFHPGSTWLDTWRIAHGDTLFYANMRNRCIDEQSTFVFRNEWLRYYEDTPEERARDANLYAFVDPARATSSNTVQRTDYLGLIVLALRSDGRRYIVEMIRDRLDLEPMVKLVFGIEDYWRAQGNPIKYWWWEDRGAGMAVDYWQLQATIKKNEAIQFLRYDDQTQKDLRIANLKAPFESGEIRLPRQMYREVEGVSRDMTQLFIQEEYRPWRPREGSYRRPNLYARNEDLLDTLAQSESKKVKELLEYPVKLQTKSWESISDTEDLNRQRRKSGKLSGAGSPWAC